jgi:UV DNA damage endonuclease
VLRHLGYVAMSLTLGVGTNRTCRLRNATPERLRALIASNLAELEQVLHFNVDRRIGLYRASSDIIPFASHPVNDLPWWDEFAGPFARLAEVIARHRMRVTMHPGQFTVLNSPREKVVADAIEEIRWHVRFLDLLGVDGSGKIVLHVGGAFGDKDAALDRFAGVVAGLPESWRRRLVIENDEHVYSIEEVLCLSRRTGLPVVFDNLHDRIHSDRDDGPARFLPACFATWGEADGPPKVHFSSQAPGGRPGHHSDWIDPDEFARFLHATSVRAFDCMLECKKKDLALLRLREELIGHGLAEVGTAVA